MRKIAPLTWLIAGLVTALAIITGCSTDKPWEPNPSTLFQVFIVSGPSDSLQVPLGSDVSYTWNYKGGTGVVQYRYRLDSNTWSEFSSGTVGSVSGFALGFHSFDIEAQDGAGTTSSVTAVFEVTEPSIPTVVITESPAAGSFVAVGSSIAFAWAGSDANTGPDYLLYRYSFGGVESNWVPAQTVTFEGVVAADPAVFTVWAMDMGGNISDPASISFVIKPASILVVDDFQWLDSFGNPDNALERDQKAFYRHALSGFAYAEWDNDVRGAVPTMTDLAGITTIIWNADSDVCHADPNYRLWFDIGAEGGGVLKQFMDAGGKLIITGSEVLNYLYNTVPPAPADFEAAYLGVSDTLVIADIDTSVVPWDTVYAETWVSSADFTWAIKDANQGADYPDSMKIDVAKNGDQLACNVSLVYLKQGVVPIFTTGLDVAGDPPDNYGEVTGWIYAPGGTAISASLMFDTYSMPGAGIQQTFHSILMEFGETPSF